MSRRAPACLLHLLRKCDPIFWQLIEQGYRWPFMPSGTAPTLNYWKSSPKPCEKTADVIDAFASNTPSTYGPRTTSSFTSPISLHLCNRITSSTTAAGPKRELVRVGVHLRMPIDHFLMHRSGSLLALIGRSHPSVHCRELMLR